jgi:hypothetical protein
MKNVPNEPYFELTENTKWSVLPDQRLLIHVDTNNLVATSSHPRILSNANFGIYTTKTAVNDSSHSWQTFIRNRSTGESFLMGDKKESFSIDLKNCFIRFCNYEKKGMLIKIFDYQRSSVYTHHIRLAKMEPVGYNDTCVFLVPSDHFEFQKKKYRYGTIISLNENGIKMIKPIRDKHEQFPYACTFYSNTFSVYKSFLYRVDKDCRIQDHCAIKIKYQDVLIDSFEVALSYYGNPAIQLKGDTLICEVNNSYRKYIGATLSGKWDLSSWVDSLPVLKDNGIGYYNKGDQLLLLVQCPAKNKHGLQQKDDKWITRSDILLKPGSTNFSILLLFDMKKNKFLGYPKLEFTTSDSL